MNIGIDLDNTIISYERSFVWCANILYPEVHFDSYSKKAIKEQVTREKGAQAWQRFQGRLYSDGLELALPFHGVMTALLQLYRDGHRVFIVSHKTRFGHYDARKKDLRLLAFEWLDAHGFLNSSCTGIQANNIFFCDTRSEKVACIASLGCDVFIDDLQEVFDHPLFPLGCRKVLFQPASGVLLDRVSIDLLREWSDLSSVLSEVRKESPDHAIE